LKSSGLYLPAAGLSLPAVKLSVAGSSASLAGQGAPPGAAVVWKLDSGKASSPSGELQGMKASSMPASSPSIVSRAIAARGCSGPVLVSLVSFSAEVKKTVEPSWLAAGRRQVGFAAFAIPGIEVGDAVGGRGDRGAAFFGRQLDRRFEEDRRAVW
jgi:hypothetical protein